MKQKVRMIESASELSDEWDMFEDVYYKKKEFLEHTEKYNPCQQHYYELIVDNRLRAGAIVYRLAISYLTRHLGFQSPYKWVIIGVPASVSCSGLIGEEKYVDLLLKEIFKIKRGLILALNINPEFKINHVVSISSFPTIVMSHNFKTWQDYTKALRSKYKRRLRLISSSTEDISIETGNCSRYNEKMHALYLNIIDRTESKLETLSLAFFKHLPDRFKLTTYSINGRIITWHINLLDDDILSFLFCGIDYELNKQYNAYLLNLSGIIKEAIELGYHTIDFGQTAEIAKTRMGGIPSDTNMFIYHRKNWMRRLFQYGKKYAHFKREIPPVNVFKKKIA
jgi:hypothetical protein